MLQVPSAATIAVPMMLVPSFKITSKPGVPPVPLMVGVLSRVMLSVRESPVSLVGSKVGTEGLAGCKVSTVMFIVVANPLALPARSFTK